MNAPIKRAISRAQFESVRGMLEAAKRKTRPRKHDLYNILCAVLHHLDSGTGWRSLPAEFPSWRTVHGHFQQWSLIRVGEKSLLEAVLEKLGCAHKGVEP
jgi:transposase